MARIKIDGLSEYQRAIQGLESMAQQICKRGLYDGAKIVADELRAKISSLSAVDDEEAVKRARIGDTALLSNRQKHGLLSSMFLSAFSNDGSSWYTKLSFTGYNNVRSEKYPKGQPNLMIAASTENGSSVRQKQPFIRPTANKVKGRVKAAMEETITSEINNLMEGK